MPLDHCVVRPHAIAVVVFALALAPPLTGCTEDEPGRVARPDAAGLSDAGARIDSGAAADAGRRNRDGSEDPSDVQPALDATGDLHPADVAQPKPDGSPVDGGPGSDAEVTGDWLSAPVEVATDPSGVVHLSCRTDADCFAALGYIQASRRFFTMDVVRRAARGRAATLYGVYGIENDLTMRPYLSTRSGRPLEEAMWERFRPDTQALFEAYAAGVNNWLGDVRAGHNGARLNEEYGYLALALRVPEAVLLGSIPDWDPLDSVAAGISALQSNGDAAPEPTFVLAQAVFPPELFADLFLPHSLADSAITDAAGQPPAKSATPAAPAGPPRQAPGVGLSALALRQLRHHSERLERARALVGWPTASNNWAVSAAHSGGVALSANDPHGGLNNPPYGDLYLLDSVTRGEGTLRVGGLCFGGVPVFWIGFADALSWTCTVSYVDTTDYYVERLSEDGQGVLFRGEVVPFVEREVVVEVFRDVERRQTFKWVPHHGPVLSLDEESGLAYTRRWTGHDAPPDLQAYLDLARVSTVAEGIDTLAAAEAMGCNAVLADRHGDVAWHVAARIPARPWASPERAPWLVLPGDGTAEWEGFVPLEQHPRLLRPASGFVATANNAFDRVWDDGDPLNEGGPYRQVYFSPNLRHARIVANLAATRGAHGLDESAALQADTFALLSPGVVEAFVAAAAGAPEPLAEGPAALVEALRAWDGTCPTGLAGPLPEDPPSDSEAQVAAAAGCAAFHAVLMAATRIVFLDEFRTYADESRFSEVGMTLTLHRALAAPQDLASGPHALWDDLETPDVVETRDEQLRRALTAGATLLSTELGQDPTNWLWGRLHTLTLRSALDGRGFHIGPYANDGAGLSVDLGAFRYAETGFAHVHGPITRLLVGMAPEGPQIRYQIPGGLDLHRDSPFYENLLPAWLRNEHLEVPWQHERAVELGATTQTLRP